MMDEHDQIIIRLTHMLNYLSKRITPQRDLTKLNRAPSRDEWSVREIVAHLRDTEARIFPKMYLITTTEYPDFRKVSAQANLLTTSEQDSAFRVMSQFRRVRQSTLSLLREIPRDAWNRMGCDVDNRTITIRDLALYLLEHDAEHLAQIDATLIARGALPHGVEPLVAV